MQHVYPNGVQKCQWWFNTFKSSKFDLLGGHRPRRPTVLNNDKMKIVIEREPCQSIVGFIPEV